MIKKTALFLKTKHIGDSIILTSAIQALPEDFTFVDVVCLPESEQIFRMNPRVRNIYPIPREQKGLKKFIHYLNFIIQIKKNNYDLLAQFAEDWRGVFLAILLRPKISICRKSIRRGVLWHSFFDLTCNVIRNSRPSSEQDVDLLRKAGLFSLPIAPSYKIIPPAENLKNISSWLKKHALSSEKKIVVIHAFSRWKFKQITLETWVEVIDYLNTKKIKVVLSGSKKDFNENLQIARKVQKRVFMAENFDLNDTAALFKLSKVVISIDSMALHMSSAVETPTLALFGPTNELNWAPWKVKHSIISLNVSDSPSFACRPCGQDGCGGSKISSCLTFIDSKRIIDELKYFI